MSHEMTTIGKREEKVCGLLHAAISVSICFAGGGKNPVIAQMGTETCTS